LKAGLEERDLLHILDNKSADEEPDVSQLLEMVFSPDDSDLLLGGEVPLTYSADPDDLLGAPLTVRNNINDVAELDELLGIVDGFKLDDDEEDDDYDDEDIEVDNDDEDEY
ncbi:MAG: hypothetical protein GX562_03880, partial [Coriobacteriaceae bacterium]|nr:hypothetical protein [Coriobacteriaceae bacterium]